MRSCFHVLYSCFCNSCLLFRGANFSVVLSRPSVFVEMVDCELHKRVGCSAHHRKAGFAPTPGIFCRVHSIEHGSNHEADEAESFCQRFNMLQRFTDSGYLEERGACNDASVLPGGLARRATGDPVRCALR